MLAVQQRLDLFHAYIGSARWSSQRETDRIIWRDLLAYAERVGDWDLYDEILSLGEPPYRDMPLRAPHKQLITYEDAGHAAVFEQADAFARLMIEEIVPRTYPMVR